MGNVRRRLTTALAADVAQRERRGIRKSRVHFAQGGLQVVERLAGRPTTVRADRLVVVACFGLLAVEIAVSAKEAAFYVGVVMFFIGLIFVLRSFYGMRITKQTVKEGHREAQLAHGK